MKNLLIPNYRTWFMLHIEVLMALGQRFCCICHCLRQFLLDSYFHIFHDFRLLLKSISHYSLYFLYCCCCIIFVYSQFLSNLCCLVLDNLYIKHPVVIMYNCQSQIFIFFRMLCSLRHISADLVITFRWYTIFTKFLRGCYIHPKKTPPSYRNNTTNISINFKASQPYCVFLYKLNNVIKIYSNNFFILVMYALCCVNLEAVEVFGFLILVKLGIMLFRRNLWLKCILALKLYFFSF